MIDRDQIGRHRLASQQITCSTVIDPGVTVSWMGAIQAQDYAAALWAVGVRTLRATEASIAQALAERQLVRTWLMRGTLHFVAPADIRWMLNLLAPRIIQRSQRRLQELGLDAAVLNASATIVEHALAGGRRLTRPALFQLLEASGITTTGQRGYYILTQLAYRQVICFGPHEGTSPTFTLLRVPAGPVLAREEALATLALRYFTSRGPATLHDFVWWSGLAVADAKDGLERVTHQLATMMIDGQRYYFAAAPGASPHETPVTVLLPPFDEFLIAYRDRSAVLDPAYSSRVVPGSNGIFKPILVNTGRVVGTWERQRRSAGVELSIHPFAQGVPAEALSAAIERYQHFCRMPVMLKDTGGA